MRQIVNSGTPKTRHCKFCKGIMYTLNSHPLKEICISQRNKSLGGLKTDFNFEVKQKVQLSITTFTSLENQTNSLRDTKEPRIRQVEGESFFNRSSVSHLKHVTLKNNFKKSVSYRRERSGEPYAFRTVLGWAVLGPVNVANSLSSQVLNQIIRYMRQA